MTLNVVIAIILRYFAEFGRFFIASFVQVVD